MIWAALELGIAVPLELGIVGLRIVVTLELGIPISSLLAEISRNISAGADERLTKAGADERLTKPGADERLTKATGVRPHEAYIYIYTY